MWLRLRQIALVAERLAPVEQALCDVLGVAVCYRDPGVATFGLENALFPVGNQFLEVVAPIENGTAGGRYLERRGGDGGYMIILQAADHAPRRERARELGIRIAFERDSEDYRIMQLHPKDTGGTFLEIDDQKGPSALDEDGPWHPAGPDWKAGQRLDRVTGIAAAELQADDPEQLAHHWGRILELPVSNGPGGALEIELENASLRFVPCRDGRPEGLGAIDLHCSDRSAIMASAQQHNAVHGENLIHLGGMRIHLL